MVVPPDAAKLALHHHRPCLHGASPDRLRCRPLRSRGHLYSSAVNMRDTRTRRLCTGVAIPSRRNGSRHGLTEISWIGRSNKNSPDEPTVAARRISRKYKVYVTPAVYCVTVVVLCKTAIVAHVELAWKTPCPGEPHESIPVPKLSPNIRFARSSTHRRVFMLRKEITGLILAQLQFRSVKVT